MAISSRAAYRAGTTSERRRLAILAFSSVIPMIANAVYVFRLAPISFPLTYAGLGITGLLIAIAISRYGFIESFVPASDVIAHLRAGIILAGTDGRIISMNEAAENFLGSSASAILGKSPSETVDAPDSTGSLVRLVQEPAGVEPRSITIETPNGLILEVQSGQVKSRRGNTVAQFVVLDDHTEQHRYERFQHRVERLDTISALVAKLSHEINNPLAFVQANVSHIVRTAGTIETELKRVGSDRAPELHDLVEAAEESLAGLHRIHEVTSSTKQLLRDPEVRHSAIDLNQVVRDSLTLSGLDQKNRTTLISRLHPARLAIHGSAAQLGQLVLNLLVNARDAVADRTDATIRVATQRCQICEGCSGGAELRVEDNGPGIPSDFREKIFVPFFTTKPLGRGTGLGLAICAEIVRNHDGTIEASQSPLGGACLSVRLPPENESCPGAGSSHRPRGLGTG